MKIDIEDKKYYTKKGWKKRVSLMQRINALQKGDLIWNIVYWGGEDRAIRKFKINKIKGGRIYFFGWSMKEQKLLEGEWFLTLKEALENQIELQQEETEEQRYAYEEGLKEIKFLKNKLLMERKNES